MTIRKNFTMPQDISENLEYIANKLNKKQSQVIQELIEDKMTEFEIEKKLEALESLSGIFTGMLPEYVNIQWIKENSEN